MAAAPIEAGYESKRLEALYRTGLLNSRREPEFDELVEIAAAICDAPVGLVTLLDKDRQCFKAAFGLDITETSREVGFCSHTIQQSGIFTIEDARTDDRFRNNPFVIAEDGVRFYAGVPVTSPDGYNLGSLCVIDHKPRRLSNTQEAALRVLGRQINSHIELRMQRSELAQALETAEAALAKLDATDRRFNAFMNTGPFLSFLKDQSGRYLFYNQPFANIFGITLEEWIGKTDHDLFPAKQADIYCANDIDVLASGHTRVIQEDTIDVNGRMTCWRSYKFTCSSDQPGETLLGCVALDITEEEARDAELRQSRTDLEEANKLLQALAATDPLTNLPNRRMFDERLQLEFSRCRRKKLALSVLMIDIDDFKKRNDSFGHAAGDSVLIQLAELLRRTVRVTDLVARYGGEEFVILLPESDEETSILFTERLLAAVREETWPNAPVHISVGVAALNEAIPDARRILILADDALYAAKRSGKNRVVGYKAYYQNVVETLLQKPSQS